MRKILLLILALVFQAKANETQIWTVNSKEEILLGRANGVSVMENGTLTLAPALKKLFDTGQLYVWSSDYDQNGNVYLGTGNEGKLFKVDPNGNGKLLADFDELGVTAIAVGKNGEIYAATSPDGKVYRIQSDGKPEIFFEPKEKYIWALAILADGSLAVGTGEKGRIYVVRQPNADPNKSVFFKSKESHIICLTTDKQGNLYAGTDPSGLVIKFTPDGKPFALLDSSLRELHDISIAPDGTIYALALSESVATIQKAPQPEPEKQQEKPSTTISEIAETVSTEKPTKSRYDFSSSKSVVYKILPEGNNVVVWNSTLTAFSILARANDVLIGTSDKGRIYSVNGEGDEMLVLESGEGQISRLKAIGNKIFAASSNQAYLYSFTDTEKVSEGSYESKVLDAKSVASWGRIWWRASGAVTLQTRSGNTRKPDETWSEWKTVVGNGSAQIQNPQARFFQWRALLRPTGILNEVSVSYLTANIAPEILSIEVLPANVGLAPNPMPPIDPNIENSGLDLQTFGIPTQSVPPRKIYQRGARALQWRAEDRNGDKLIYSIYYKEVNDADFKLLVDNLTENFYTIDGLSLPDGRYIFKLVVSDATSNSAKNALKTEKVTEPIDIDNSPPVIKEVEKQVVGNRARAVFEATDSSYLTRAEYNINGGQWRKIYPEDGISDSPKERYIVEIPIESNEVTLTIRVFDSNGNIGNAKAVFKK